MYIIKRGGAVVKLHLYPYMYDISAPAMINTQKLTALVFSFYDGYRSQ